MLIYDLWMELLVRFHGKCQFHIIWHSQKGQKLQSFPFNFLIQLNLKVNTKKEDI